MRGILAVVLVAALLAPSMAWAVDYPRRLTIDGRDCVEEQTSSGRIATSCLVDGLWRVMATAAPAPQAAAPAGAPTTPEAPQRLQLAPDLARLELRPYQGGRITPRYVSYEVAEALADVSLKHSWSGPLKWSAITLGALGAVASVSYLAESGPLRPSEHESRATTIGALFGTAAVSLLLALAIDADARADVMRAAGITEQERDAIDAAREPAQEEAEARTEAESEAAEGDRPSRHRLDRPFR